MSTFAKTIGVNTCGNCAKKRRCIFKTKDHKNLRDMVVPEITVDFCNFWNDIIHYNPKERVCKYHHTFKSWTAYV